MYTKNRLSLGFPLILAIALGFGAAGCSASFEGYQPVPTTAKVPVAQWTTSQLDLRFESGKAKLAEGEEGRLLSALAQEDPSRPLTIVARTNAAGTTPALAIERAAALRRVMEAKGFKVAFQPPGQGDTSAMMRDPKERDAAVVYVGRYEVTVPGCPDWRKPAVTDYSNTASSNLGCANAMNLGLMVADPGDLSHGDQLVAADATREADAVEKYRAGKAPRVGKIDMPDPRSIKKLSEGGTN